MILNLSPAPRALTAAGLALALGVAGARAGAAWAGRDDVAWSFAEVAARVLPATVAISAERGQPTAMGLDELRADLGLTSSEPEAAVATSTGSGVIVRADGLVLTNHHVVASERQLTVTLYDHRQLPATVVASDPRSDVALLQIRGPGPFATAPIGDSDRVRVGDPVLTVGHPFELAFTVTSGIVSARGRRDLNQDEIQDYIQTDAAVNPGVSGGPLFDARGAVVGLATAVYSASRSEGPAASGLSFAIPINQAWRVSQELLNLGHVRRPWAGLEAEDPPRGAESGAALEGAIVTRVAPRGPASQAGLEVGDRIVEVSGLPVAGRADLASLVSVRAVGETLRLRVARGEARLDLALTLGDRLDASDLDASIDVEDPEARTWLGATFLPPLAPPAPQGARVVAVRKGTPAFIGGLLPGDVVQGIGAIDVQDLSALSQSDSWPSALLLRVWRRDGPVVIAVANP